VAIVCASVRAGGKAGPCRGQERRTDVDAHLRRRQDERASHGVRKVVMIAGKVIDLRAPPHERQQLLLQLAVVEKLDLAGVELRLERLVKFGLSLVRRRVG
jgi:hypothetical protein